MTKELVTDESIVDPVEERRTLAERNERLHDQLRVIFFFFPLKVEKCAQIHDFF